MAIRLSSPSEKRCIVNYARRTHSAPAGRTAFVADEFSLLAFKQQDRISYLQTELQGILGDYIFSLQRLGIEDYQKAPVVDLWRSAV